MFILREIPSPDCSGNPFLKKKIATKSGKQLQKHDHYPMVNTILLLTSFSGSTKNMFSMIFSPVF